MEPTKSILLVALRNMDKAEKLFRGMGMKVVTDESYKVAALGDYLHPNAPE